MKNPFKKETDKFGRPVEIRMNDVFSTKIVVLSLTFDCSNCNLSQTRSFDASLNRETSQIAYCHFCNAMNKIQVPAANSYKGE